MCKSDYMGASLPLSFGTPSTITSFSHTRKQEERQQKTREKDLKPAVIWQPSRGFYISASVVVPISLTESSALGL